MSAIRKNLFPAALVLLVLVAVGEGVVIYQRAAAARAAEAKIVRQRATLAELSAAAPAPSQETAAQIESDLARAQRALGAMQAELRGRGPAADRLKNAKIPAARTDAFFDLATFVEAARARAKQQGVALAPAATHFGFSLYANEAPEVALIAPVYHQRLVVQYLAEALLDARPRAILAIQRERPLSEDERKTRAEALAAVAAGGAAREAPPADSAALSPDYFDLDPRMAAPAGGATEVTAFRIVFTGQTAALRAFLNKLSGFELPVIVRGVEVTPAAVEDAVETAEILALPARETTPAATPASVMLTANVPEKTRAIAAPLVPKTLSTFTVTVEFIDLVPPAIPAAAPATS